MAYPDNPEVASSYSFQIYEWVERSPRHPEVKGSILATAVGTGSDEMAKKLFNFAIFLSSQRFQ